MHEFVQFLVSVCKGIGLFVTLLIGTVLVMPLVISMDMPPPRKVSLLVVLFAVAGIIIFIESIILLFRLLS